MVPQRAAADHLEESDGPSLHTSEDSRWDYRIVINYKDQSSSTHEGEVLRELFADQATLRKDENRRWS
jgi:hypothetical protein